MVVSFITILYGCVVDQSVIDQNPAIIAKDKYQIDYNAIINEGLIYMEMPHDQKSDLSYRKGLKNPVYMGIYVGEIFNLSYDDDVDYEFDLEKLIIAKHMFDLQVKKLNIDPESVKRPQILICNTGCPCCK